MEMADQPAESGYFYIGDGGLLVQQNDKANLFFSW